MFTATINHQPGAKVYSVDVTAGEVVESFHFGYGEVFGRSAFAALEAAETALHGVSMAASVMRKAMVFDVDRSGAITRRRAAREIDNR